MPRRTIPRPGEPESPTILFGINQEGIPLAKLLSLSGHQLQAYVRGDIRQFCRYMSPGGVIKFQIAWPGYVLPEPVPFQINSQTTMADVAKEVANHLFAYMARVKRDLTKGSNASFDILNLNIPYSCVHIHGLKMAPYGPIWQPMISLDL